MRSSEYLPIPKGGAKLIGFVCVVLFGAVPLIWWSMSTDSASPSIVALIYVIGLFSAVKIVHPDGWTSWIRDYYRRNVQGVFEVCTYDVNTRELLSREISLVPPFHPKDGTMTIAVKVTGWFRSKQHLLFWEQALMHNVWYIRYIPQKRSLRDIEEGFLFIGEFNLLVRGIEFPNPYMEFIEQLRFSQEQVVDVILATTNFSGRVYHTSMGFKRAEASRPYIDVGNLLHQHARGILDAREEQEGSAVS